MLAFDIETTGLDPRKSVVTCVCAEDFHSGRKYTFEFAKVRHESPHTLHGLECELVQILEEAPTLCAFNGIRFDTPFLQAALGLDRETMRRWNCKTSDILEHCRNVHKHTFSLNLLCETNGIPVKTGDGLQAIRLAKERKWAELREYCAHDVHILCDLYRKRHLTNPRTGRVMDLADCAAKYVYADAGEHKLEQNGKTNEVASESMPVEAAGAVAGEAATGTTVTPGKTTAAPDSFTAWFQAVATRLHRLPCVRVSATDVFGVAERRFCVAMCPICDAEGFIQEDTQLLAGNCCAASIDSTVYSCGMRHAYRIAVRETRELAVDDALAEP
jgi:hypothetical protein